MNRNSGNGRASSERSRSSINNNNNNNNNNEYGSSSGNGGRRNSYNNNNNSSSRHNSRSTSSMYGRNVNSKPLTVIPLMLLTFYGVSGGPFGIEETIKAGGPLLTMIAMFFLPLIWSLPEALITAELATTYPEASGFVAWVSAAFGPYWGFQEGYLSWLSGVTDNSLYPVLFLDYFIEWFGTNCILAHGWERQLFLLSISFFLTYLNYRGMELVGNAVIMVCVFSLLPFVIMCVLGVFQMDFQRVLQLPVGGMKEVDWPSFINILFWNLNYWDSAASFAGEVENPGTTFPLAMKLAVILVVLSSGLPLFVGVGVSHEPYEVWTDGHFSQIAFIITGTHWLGLWIVIAAAVSNIGMFLAEMSSDSLQLMGMAEHGMLPKIFAKKSSHGTPTYSILLSATGVMLLAFMSFMEIIEILNFLYCIAELLEFAAFIKLRISKPDLHRPYKIPLNTVGCCIMLLPATALILYVLSCATMKTIYICGIFACGGFILEPFINKSREMKLCSYINLYDEEGEYIHNHSFTNNTNHYYTEVNSSQNQENDDQKLDNIQEDNLTTPLI